LISMGWVEGRNPIPPAAGLNPTCPHSGLFVQALFSKSVNHGISRKDECIWQKSLPTAKRPAPEYKA